MLFFFVAGQVGRGFFPAQSLIAGAQQVLGSVVKGARFVLRPDDGGVPVEAVLHVLGVAGQVLDGGSHDIGAGFGAGVQHFDGAQVAAAEHVARVVGVEGQEGALAASRGFPASGGDAAAAELAAGDDHRGIVLLPAVDAVGELIVHVDAVNLGGGHIALGRPSAAVIQADAHPAIIGDGHVFRIVGVDPQIVVIAVGAIDVFPGAPAVEGAQGWGAEHVNGMLVLGVGEDLDVVPGALHQAVVAGDSGPTFSGIGRDEQATFFLVRITLDEGIDPLGVRAANRHGHLAQLLGQALLDFGPGLAPVHGLVQPAAGAAADDFPGQAAMLPQGSVEHQGVVHIHRKLGAAGLFVHVQHLAPGGAAVGRFINAALGRRPVQGALCRNEDDVGVLRVDGDAGDVLGAGQPQLLPGLPGIGRFIDAVAVVGLDAARRVLAHAYIDDIGVALRHGDGTH